MLWMKKWNNICYWKCHRKKKVTISPSLHALGPSLCPLSPHEVTSCSLLAKSQAGGISEVKSSSHHTKQRATSPWLRPLLLFSPWSGTEASRTSAQQAQCRFPFDANDANTQSAVREWSKQSVFLRRNASRPPGAITADSHVQHAGCSHNRRTQRIRFPPVSSGLLNIKLTSFPTGGVVGGRGGGAPLPSLITAVEGWDNRSNNEPISTWAAATAGRPEIKSCCCLTEEHAYQ